MKSILLVGAGGFLGSVVRYLVSIAAPDRLLGIPFPTLAVNVAGSFVVGSMLALGEARLGADAWRFVVIGCLGGFTTFSAFSAETLALARTGHVALMAATVSAHVVLGISAAALGYALVARG